MSRLDQLFQQFLRERTYINNVTASTREWYECAWKAFAVAQKDAPERNGTDALISKTDLQHFVVHLRQRGLRPVSCNTWIRALNAFCRWLHEQGEIPTLVKLAPQRLEKRIIRTHDAAALKALLSCKPKTFPHWRLYALVATILDTACRIEGGSTSPSGTKNDFDCEERPFGSNVAHFVVFRTNRPPRGMAVSCFRTPAKTTRWEQLQRC